MTSIRPHNPHNFRSVQMTNIEQVYPEWLMETTDPEVILKKIRNYLQGSILEYFADPLHSVRSVTLLQLHQDYHKFRQYITTLLDETKEGTYTLFEIEELIRVYKNTEYTAVKWQVGKLLHLRAVKDSLLVVSGLDKLIGTSLFLSIIEKTKAEMESKQ